MAESGPKPGAEIAKSEIREIPKAAETSQERFTQLSAELENLTGKIKERAESTDAGTVQQAQDTSLERTAERLHLPSQEAAATPQDSSQIAGAVDERNARVQELMQDLNEIESLLAKYSEQTPEEAESKGESANGETTEDPAAKGVTEQIRGQSGESRVDSASANNLAVEDFLRSWHESRSQKRVAQQAEQDQRKEIKGDEVQKELDAQKRDLEINKKERIDFQQAIESNKNKTRALAAERKENSSRIDETSERIDQTKQSIEQKQGDITSLSGEITTLSEQHAGIVHRLSEAKGDERTALQQQADTIQGMIDAKKETRTAYEAEAKQLQETFEKDRALLSELQEKEKEYAATAERLQNEAVELKEDAADKDREIAFREQLIEALEDLVHKGITASDSQMDRSVLVIPGGGKPPYLKFNVA